MIEEIAIAFHTWMMYEDTTENAERWTNFTDKDMFNAFLEINPKYKEYVATADIVID